MAGRVSVIEHLETEGEIVPPTIDFDEFHEQLMAAGDVPVKGFTDDDLSPLTITVPDGRAYSYLLNGGKLGVRRGTVADSGCVVELPEAIFAEYANELLTAAGVYAIGAGTYSTGSFVDFDRWEPLIRYLYTDRAIYDPALLDAGELSRVFTTDDDDRDIGAFVRRNGFAVVRDVFSGEEVARIGDEIEALMSAARPDDGDSWWTEDRDGNAVPCQMAFLGLHSRFFADFNADPRFRRFAGIFGHGVRSRAGGQGLHVIIKHVGASKGIVNPPWHLDCGMGGHPVLCPTLVMGIELTALNDEMGGLYMLPGSHRCSVPRADPTEMGWPQVVVQAGPGDVTVHSSHLLHAAPPPSGDRKARRTLYNDMSSPAAYSFFGFHRSDRSLSNTMYRN